MDLISVSRRLALGLACATLLTAGTAMAQPATQVVRPASVEGPIPIAAGEKVWEGRVRLTPPATYVQEEYVLTGEIGGKAYRTQMIVQRPRDPRKFSGVIVVEQLHGGGMPAAFPSYREYLWRHGLGYAFIAADRQWLDVWVKAANPQRYASLAIPELEGPLVPSRFNETTNMSPLWMASLRRSVRQRPMTFGIMDQAAALFKAGSKDSPFHGYKVRRAIMTGASGTGFETISYIDEPYPKSRLADGSHPFDGFLPQIAPSTLPVPPIDAPVIHVVAQADFTGLHSLPYFYRRPDGDAPGDRFRLYEVPGADHGDTSVVGRDGRAGGRGSLPNPNQFPLRFVMSAALDNLIRWIDDGVPPPRAPWIQVDPLDGQVVTDEDGNARGGVRSTYLDVPVGSYRFEKVFAADAAGMLGRATTTPLSPERLAKLYPTPESYLAQVEKRLGELVRERWILPEDAATVRAEAVQTAAAWAKTPARP